MDEKQRQSVIHSLNDDEGRDSNDANKIQQTKKEIIAASGSYLVSFSDEFDDQYNNGVEYQCQGRGKDTSSGSRTENDETSESISESTSEEYSSEFEDTDYDEDGSNSSQSNSDDESHSSDENLEVDEHDVVHNRKGKVEDVLEDELDAGTQSYAEQKEEACECS
ncbi:hypothetical protein M9H77_33002 [Catharanthus roseus]|uniref:Uncharacterized protein n=1 Tax=Catharanthus roseus TaxID=4058 RepID=A0ACC0A5Y4_CATRO|nr:hypothetical protein M9H77_33002 [Catharanthus roseus]